jgi:hypothetical protein
MGEVATVQPVSAEDIVLLPGGSHYLEARSSAPSLGPLASATVCDVIEANVIHAAMEDAFFVADMGAVVRQHRKWKAHLPRVVRGVGEKA